MTSSERKITTLDSSQIKTFLACQQKWHYQYELSIRPMAELSSPIESSSALVKGDLFHQILDVYYRAKSMKADSLKDLITHTVKTIEERHDGRDIEPEVLDFLIRRFYDYVGYYYQNNGEFNNIRNVETGFSKILYEDDERVFVIEGRIDLIVNHIGRPTWVDHKTQSSHGTLHSRDPQFLTYAWATGINTGMINYIGLQKSVLPHTFHRQIVCFSTETLEAWEKRLIEIFRRVELASKTQNFDKNETNCMSYRRVCPYDTLCGTTDKRTLVQIQSIDYKEVPRWEPWRLNEE